MANTPVRQYIGARYVPLFADPAEWDDKRTYEPLTIVIHQGNSYTSRQYVPAGIDITNNEYWALTGNYNAQIEQYHQEVQNLANTANSSKEILDSINWTNPENAAEWINNAEHSETQTTANTNALTALNSETTEKATKVYNIIQTNNYKRYTINIKKNNIDDTNLINNEIIKARTLGYRYFYIPNGTYKAITPITLQSFEILEGESSTNTVLEQNYNHDDPSTNVSLITPILHNDVSTGQGYQRITVKNIRVKSKGPRTEYPIMFQNVYNLALENVTLLADVIPPRTGTYVPPTDNRPERATGPYHAIVIGGRVNGYTGDNWLGKVYDVITSHASLIVKMSDVDIRNVYVYPDWIPDGYPYGLDLQAGNISVIGSAIAHPHPDNSASLRISASDCRISQVWFEGSSGTNHTNRVAIYLDGAQAGIIENCTIWNSPSEAIKSSTEHYSTYMHIVNNQIRNSSYLNNDGTTPDITINGPGYVITSNTFYRHDKYFNITTHQEESRTKAPIFINNSRPEDLGSIMSLNTARSQYLYTSQTTTQTKGLYINNIPQDLFAPQQ